MLKKIATSLLVISGFCSIANANTAAAGAMAEPAVCMMPVPAPQMRLQKTYLTSDRIFLTDNGIFFLDYNNTVQSTFGIFTDGNGLYVFTNEPIYTILPCPMGAQDSK